MGSRMHGSNQQYLTTWEAKPKNTFTIGITDDVTNSSLETVDISTEPEGTVKMLVPGLGTTVP